MEYLFKNIVIYYKNKYTTKPNRISQVNRNLFFIFIFPSVIVYFPHAVVGLFICHIYIHISIS